MITIDEFRKMELRIAEILSAAPHPQADKLLVLKGLTLLVPEREISSGAPVR